MTTPASETPTPRDHVETSVGQTFDAWCQQHFPDANLSEERAQIVARAPVWMGPASVLAGVTDILAPARPQKTAIPADVLADLSNAIITTIKQGPGFSTSQAFPYVRKMR